MNTAWDRAIAFVLKQEGEYTCDPKDPGGETKYGISKKSYPSLDIKSLTVDQAKEIYRRDYWLPCACDELPDAFAIAVFDTAVNQGVTRARRMLQMALDVDVDGRIGPRTIGAAARAGHGQVKKFLALRLADYARLMAENKNLLVFATNWSYRVISLAELLFVLFGGVQQSRVDS